jgi:hypothetical protein
MKRIVLSVFALALAACGGGEPETSTSDAPTAAESASMDPMTEAVEMGGPLGGWYGRADGDASTDEVVVTREGDTWQIDNGPAVVLWHPGVEASGDYTLSATFSQISGKGMVHGTGLVFGGSAIDGPDQAYTYFMIRGSGDFLVKTRQGDETFWVAPTDGWTQTDAVNQTDENDQHTNDLAVQIDGDDAVFMINGTEVLRIAKSEIPADGLYGVRANHQMTVQFTDPVVEGGM